MNISFSSYRNSDYVRLFSEVILICKAYTVEVLEAISIAAYYQELQSREVQINLALGKNQKNPYTSQVSVADQKRDDALDAFKFFLQYSSKQEDPVIRAAALRLITVLKTIGWSLQRENYSEETKQVRSFIAKIEEDSALQADIASCLSTALFEKIKTTQTAFEELLSEFNKYETDQKDIDPSAEKAWLRETIGSMVEDLNYHCRKQTNAECQQIHDQLETVANSISANIKTRQTKADNDETEPESEA